MDNDGDTEGVPCQVTTKVGVEEQCENLKDEEGHLMKNKAVGKLIKIEAIHHEICETVDKNFLDLRLTHNSVGDYTREK